MTLRLGADDRRSFGYDGAFIGTTITRASFKKDFGITAATSNNVSSNITSVYQAGAFFGAIFCFFSKLSSRRTETDDFGLGLIQNPLLRSYRADWSEMGSSEQPRRLFHRGHTYGCRNRPALVHL